MPVPQLILGSSSPFRKELLSRLCIPFECESPSVDETPLSNETPSELCVRLAKLKARAVAKNRPGCIVIGCDQVLDFNGKCVGKPHTRENAFKQLTEMAGNTMVFHSAMCVIDPKGNEQIVNVPTEITMRDYSASAVNAYLDLEEPYNCAGSAKMEKLGIALVKEYKSPDPTAIIGLPLIELTGMLFKAGLEVLPGLFKKE